MNTPRDRNKLDALGGIRRALRSRNLVLYCSGLGLTLTGSFVFAVAMGWVTWELTNSVGWVGGMVLAETLPTAIISPIAGVIIDRTGSRLVLFWAQLLAAILMAALTVVTFLDLLSVEVLLLFAISLGSLNGIAFPAHFALMARLVPREDLSAAIAFQSSVSQGARFLGPAVAGVLLVSAGGVAAFAFNTFSYAAFLTALLLIKVDEGGESRPASRGVIRDFTAGLQHAWNSLPLRILMVIAIAVGILLRPIIELMPGYVGSVLKAEAGALAWLLAAAGAGAMFASLWLARRGRSEGLTRIMLLNLLITALALIGFMLTGSLVAGIGILVIYGFCSTTVLITNQTLIQGTVEEHMRARVMSLYSLTIRAVPAFGAFVVGQLADRVGLTTSILGGAAIGLLFWLWMRHTARRNRIAEQLE